MNLTQKPPCQLCKVSGYLQPHVASYHTSLSAEVRTCAAFSDWQALQAESEPYHDMLQAHGWRPRTTTGAGTSSAPTCCDASGGQAWKADAGSTLHLSRSTAYRARPDGQHTPKQRRVVRSSCLKTGHQPMPVVAYQTYSAGLGVLQPSLQDMERQSICAKTDVRFDRCAGEATGDRAAASPRRGGV